MRDSNARPTLVLRVGVTGTRRISPERIPTLRSQIEDVLRLVRKQLVGLSANPRAKTVYATDGAAQVPFALRMISPLAEGTDRLVAEVALDLGFELFSPLPFMQGDYEKDFPETLDAFRRLVSKAHVVELDGARGTFEKPSYEAVGRYVVRNCDLLIALWDGQPAEGQGGTAEIVRFAARSDLPVWWIDAETGAPRLIANASQFRRLERGLDGDRAKAALTDYLSNLILPPIVTHPNRHGIMGRVAHRYCRFIDYDPHPLERFLGEPSPKPSLWIWRTFGKLYRVLAPPGDTPTRPLPPQNDIQQYWAGRYARADALSVAYGDKYRSSYVLIILLAFLTFCISIGGGVFRCEAIKVGLELATLLCVGCLVWENHVQGWQERWIAYRLVAELCRKQIMLAHLGRTLPGTDVNRVTFESAIEPDLSALPREAWVSWYYLALLRAAPSPQTSAALAKRRAFDAGRGLVLEQGAYHHRRQQRAGTADRRLARYSDMFFVVTVAGLTVVLALLLPAGLHGPAKWIETMAVVFSAASAAFVGLRAYAEFALLAQQSRRMEKIMTDITAELDNLDIEAPLASLDLGTILQRLAGLMMQDVSGWAQLFRLKAVEAG